MATLENKLSERTQNNDQRWGDSVNRNNEEWCGYSGTRSSDPEKSPFINKETVKPDKGNLKNEVVTHTERGREDENVKQKVKKTYPDLDKEPLLENVAAVTILPPPSKINTIHKAILAKLQDSGVKLEDSDNGPCIVTVVNSSRLQADMERDLREARG